MLAFFLARKGRKTAQTVKNYRWSQTMPDHGVGVDTETVIFSTEGSFGKVAAESGGKGNLEDSLNSIFPNR